MSNELDPEPIISPISRRDSSSWPESTTGMFSPGEIELIRAAQDFSQLLYDGKDLPTGEPVMQHVLGVASLLASLRVDSDTLAGSMLYAAPDYLEGYKEKLSAAFNPTVAQLVEGVARMGRIRLFGATDSGNVSS
ncbi:MAG: HD domain-containing protein, partial [Pseudomonadota bacterium]|nr:HD domain-containing protein [Pseudomonadota bacterium]